jgi:activator of HSP90 ATPase
MKASALYNMYLDAKEHGTAIDSTVKISKKEGAAFSADGKYITGKNLQLMQDRLIVQSWRASDWKKSDADSTFILYFDQQEDDAVINMVHANIPDSQYEGIKKGWDDYYWKPWKKYLAVKKVN